MIRSAPSVKKFSFSYNLAAPRKLKKIMVMGMSDIRIPFEATLPFTLHKADVDSERGALITVCVSDNLLDYQGDKMDIEVLKKIVRLAKEGKIELRRHHDDAFHIARSVDGSIQEEPNGRVSVFVTFRAVEIGDREYYPEVHHLLKAFSQGEVLPLEASVGGWITKYTTELEKGKPVRIIKDAEVDHVAFTPPKGAANPRTGVYQVFVKSLISAIDRYEGKSKGWQEVGGDDEMTDIITEKNIYIELEKCNRERRRLSYTRHDIEELHKRSQKWGIPPTPFGNIIKPDFYLDVDEFADEVNYLFPLTKERLLPTINFFRKNPDYILSIYDAKTAGKVFARLIEKALSEGLEVNYEGAWIDALIPEPLAMKLKGFNPNAYRLQKTWLEQLDDAQIKLVAGLHNAIYDTQEVNIDEATEELRKREEKYGYQHGENARLVPDPTFKSIPLSKFADPVGYNFPITPEWVITSYTAFMRPEVRALYDANAQKVIFKRILDAMYDNGARIAFDPNEPLHRVYIHHPVFLGTEDYLEEKNVGEEAMQEVTEKVEELRKRFVLRKQSDAPVTAAEAPHYPFVIPGLTFIAPAAKPGKLFVRVHPSYINITKEAKKDDVILQVFTLEEISRKMNVKGWDKPEDIKISWVGTKDAKNPIAEVEGRHEEGKAFHDDAGVKIVGSLKIKSLELKKEIGEVVIFSDGTVAEIIPIEDDDETDEKLK